MVVVEVEYGLAKAEYTESVVNALPFCLARRSKYVLGLNNVRADCSGVYRLRYT
jgi:hypothetical protein